MRVRLTPATPYACVTVPELNYFSAHHLAMDENGQYKVAMAIFPTAQAQDEFIKQFTVVPPKGIE